MSDDTQALRQRLRALLRMDEPALDGGMHRVVRALGDALGDFVDEQAPRIVEEAVGQAPASRRTAVLEALRVWLSECRPWGEAWIDHEQEPPSAEPSVALSWRHRGCHLLPVPDLPPPHTFVVGDWRVRLERRPTPPTQGRASTRTALRLVLAPSSIATDGRCCVVGFEHRPDPERRSQAKLDGEAVQQILARVPADLAALLRQGGDPRTRPGATTLGQQLRAYTRRRAGERWIRREPTAWLHASLDAHLRHGGLGLDLLDTEPGAAAEAVAVARAVRRSGRALIAWLARLEALRGRLFSRPKLVLDPGWLVSVVHVPEALRPQVCANAAQVEQWRRRVGEAVVDASPLTPARLAALPHLCVDTRLFDERFEEQLLAALPPQVLGAAHVALQGDNLDALRSISGAGPQAACVFIDPPYNTGSRAFAYPDTFTDAGWISLLWERLRAAREVMRDDGVLVATIDDGEVAHLRLLLEAVFGAQSFVTQAVWHKKYARQNDATWFSTSHDHLLVVARDKARWRPNPLPRRAATDRGYKNPDDDPRGPWQSVVYTCNKTAEQRPNLYYAITHPDTGRQVWPKANRVWAFSPQAHARNEQEGRVWWGRKRELDKPRLKVFLRDVDRGVVPDTLWTRDEVGDNQDAQRELAALFGVDEGFSTPKPTALVERVITLGSRSGDTVLDFFAGSGTTAHAVLALQRAGQGPRRFVVVESGETFERVLVPRIEKVAFSSRWSEGRPEPGDGVPLLCRVARLQSYDDLLEALAIETPPSSMLAPWLRLQPWRIESMGEGVVADPFALRTTAMRHGRATEARVGLRETFELLVGLRPHHRGASEWLDATFEREDGCSRVQGELRAVEPDAAAHRVQAIRGELPDGRRALLLWRTADPEVERDRAWLLALIDRELAARDEPAPELVWTNGLVEPLAHPRVALERVEDTLRERLAAAEPPPP